MHEFVLKLSIHGTPSVEASCLPPERVKAVKRFVTENRMDAEAYKAKVGVSPFIQACSRDYLLIEFWGADKERIVRYISLLNVELTRPLEEWEKELS